MDSRIFFTDTELRKRWSCSHMKLWRLRKAGKLPRPIKIGGCGQNLTPASVVMAIEGATLLVSPEAA